MNDVRVEIALDGQNVVTLGIPPEGLVLGGDAKADVCLPALKAGERWRVVYLDGRVEFSALVGSGSLKGSTKSLRVGDRDQIGPYELTPIFPSTLRKNPTRKLIYDAGTHTLETQSLRLRIETPEGGPAATVDLPEGRSVLGKDPGCDIVLSDVYVSARHAALTASQGRVTVLDLSSRNGVKVDGRQVKEAELREGQTVAIGRTVISLIASRDAERLEVPEKSVPGLVGECEEMRRVAALVGRVAPTSVTILIEGETGTGKEIVARGLHSLSTRASGPFIPVNCGAIPKELIESELFGHVRGAFTGAVADRRGLFSLASGGTLFLDEVGELPQEMQVRMLRVLEDGRIRPVGGGQEIFCDVRIVAATNRNLDRLTAEKVFREDLLYRLRQVPVVLPPLRKRGDDIDLLANHFLATESRALDRADPGFAPSAVKRIRAYPWPGNVRELKTAIIRALVIIAPGRPIEADDLLLNVAEAPVSQTLEQIETDAVRRALAEEKTRDAAARRLGIAASTLYEKIKKYGL